jgi:hypothetical protein
VALTESLADRGYREFRAHVYQTLEDGRKRLNGRCVSVIIHDPNYEYVPRVLQFPETIQSAEVIGPPLPGYVFPRCKIVTYYRHEEWLNGRRYRYYYVRETPP